MKISKRLVIHGPQWSSIWGPEKDIEWWRCWLSLHSCDEYGNCTLLIESSLLGGFTLTWDPHYQDTVTMPDIGWHPWIDAKYWTNDANKVATVEHQYTHMQSAYDKIKKMLNRITSETWFDEHAKRGAALGLRWSLRILEDIQKEVKAKSE